MAARGYRNRAAAPPLAVRPARFHTRRVSGASRWLAVVAVAAPLAGLACWLLADPARTPRSERARPPPTPPAARPAPPPVKGETRPPAEIARWLEARLAHAVELGREFDPVVPRLLEDIAHAADLAGLADIAARARGALADYQAASKAWDQETYARTREEARALARDGSPAALSRFAEAIAWAHATDGPEAVKALEAELEAFRFELRRRDVVAAVDRDRAGEKDDGTTDDDPLVRAAFEALARGDASVEPALVKRLADRMEVEHLAGACKLAVRDGVLARSAMDRSSSLVGHEARRTRAVRALLQAELRCRLEEAGRCVRRADGPAALALLDMVELAKLDEQAPGSARIHYLLGRALEADGKPDEAQEDYLAAIGTASWLPADSPIELLRWFARCRAGEKMLTRFSPGVGAGWRRIARPTCVVFEELGEQGLGLGGRVERARRKAIERLGLGEPTRLQALKPVIFVYASEEHYRRGAAPTVWAGGHAQWDELEDGLASTIVVYATEELEDTLVHEWTHVVVNDHMKGERLPSWAIEGVATWAEEGETQKLRLSRAARELERLPGWGDFLAASRDPRYVGSDGDFARQFYAQALLAFETAVRRLGNPGAVLAAASKIVTQGGDPFAPLGFKDEEDFAGAAGVVIPQAKK